MREELAGVEQREGAQRERAREREREREEGAEERERGLR